MEITNIMVCLLTFVPGPSFLWSSACTQAEQARDPCFFVILLRGENEFLTGLLSLGLGSPAEGKNGSLNYVDLGMNTLGTLIHCKLWEQEQDVGIADNYYRTIATL